MTNTDTAHHRYSPSAATRWTSCTASVPLLASLNLPRKSSEYAAKGTFLHAIRAQALLLNTEARSFIGETGIEDGFEFTFTEEDAQALQPGINHLRELLHSKPNGVLLVEKKVDLGAYIPRGFGTSDAIVVFDDELHVNDFKGGAGHSVDPDGNFQLMLYAAGAVKVVESLGRPLPDKVVLWIDQPYAGGIKSWETTREFVENFAKACGDIAKDIEAGNVKYEASEENCRWCDAQPHCGAAAKRALALCDFKGAKPKLNTALTPRMRSKILRHRDQIESWLKALHEQAQQDALQGKPVPGFKLVEGRRGNRQWVDEDEAARTLRELVGDRAFKSSVISPTAAEKLVAPELLPATVQASGKPTLVPEEDKRPSITLF